MELSVITSVAAFTLLAALCSTVFNKIKLPPLIGYIVAGIVITTVWTVPESGMEMVDVLSDIGLVMLMFCIGLEINLKKIRKQGLFAIGIVVIQLPIMMIGGIVVDHFGYTPAFFTGAAMLLAARVLYRGADAAYCVMLPVAYLVGMVAVFLVVALVIALLQFAYALFIALLPSLIIIGAIVYLIRNVFKR